MRRARKYSHRTWAEAEAAHAEHVRLVGLQRTALDELLKGNGIWRQQGRFRIGLLRPTAMDGGTAILMYDAGVRGFEFCRVALLDDFVHEELGSDNRRATRTNPDLVALVAKVRDERDRLADEDYKRQQARREQSLFASEGVVA